MGTTESGDNTPKTDWGKLFSGKLFDLGFVLLISRFAAALGINKGVYTREVVLCYSATQIAYSLVMYMVYCNIKKVKDNTTLKYVERNLTIFKKDEDEPEYKPVTTNVYFYDLKQLTQVLKSDVLMLVINAVIAYKITSKTPLLIHTIFCIKNMLKSKLFMVHVLKRPAEGDLARPWNNEAVKDVSVKQAVAKQKKEL